MDTHEDCLEREERALRQRDARGAEARAAINLYHATAAQNEKLRIALSRVIDAALILSNCLVQSGDEFEELDDLNAAIDAAIPLTAS